MTAVQALLIVPAEEYILESCQNAYCLHTGKCRIVLRRAVCSYFVFYISFSAREETLNPQRITHENTVLEPDRRIAVSLHNNILACMSLPAVAFLTELRQTESGLSAERLQQQQHTGNKH